MIDTDKYEGHTPAPWAITNDGIVGVTEPEDVTLHVLSGCYSETDAQLIADAPLLLAEVKRLREAFITAVRHVGEHDLSRDDLFSKLDEDLFSLWLFRSE